MKAGDIISLTVLTPENTLMEKRVSKVSLPGTMGRFMILKNHAPLISSLDEGDIVFTAEDVEERIHISSGFVEVNADVVTVCAEL